MVTALLLAASLAHGSDQPLTPELYAEKFELRTGDEADQAAIKRCIDAWANQPFGAGPWKARWIETNVRITGLGNETVDDVATVRPQLIFVKPAVSVMTKTTLQLLNPNGWYCIESSVTVMGKLVVQATCGAQLADSRSGATVMGSTDAAGGVTVMGATRVEKVGCPQ